MLNSYAMFKIVSYIGILRQQHHHYCAAVVSIIVFRGLPILRYLLSDCALLIFL